MKTIFLLNLSILTLVSCNSRQETKPERKDIVDAVFASGSIISKSEYLVTANAQGYLQSSFVSEGDTVSQGQPLFRIFNEVQQAKVKNALISYEYALKKEAENAPQIQQLESQIKQALEQYMVDSINYRRYERLVKTKAVSQADYEKALLQFQNAETNVHIQQKNLADLRLSLSLNSATAKNELIIQSQNNQYYLLNASVHATVLNIYKKNGDFVKQGETLARLGTGDLTIKLLIAEEDIQRVKLGMKLVVSLNTERYNLYNATISKVYPGFDNNQQSFVAEAVFENIPENLKIDTQLQANIIVAEKSNAIVIPSNYLYKNNQVNIKNENKPRSVTIGIRNLEWAEILSGLSEDEIVELPR